VHSLILAGRIGSSMVSEADKGEILVKLEFPTSYDLAQILLKFSERDQRRLSIHDLQNEVRGRLSSYPDAIVFVTRPSVVGGQMSEVEMEIAGEDLDTLDRMALKTRELALEIPGIRDPDTTVRTGKPELRIYPDRAVLADLGYPATGLGMTLRANMEGITAGTFKQGDRNYDIVVKLEDMTTPSPGNTRS
jgi:HAE1 family hydrophobic/amphiphilic exporter-1